MTLRVASRQVSRRNDPTTRKHDLLGSVIGYLKYPISTLRPYWSYLLQVGFAAVAVPVGCAVLAGTVALGALLGAVLSWAGESGSVVGSVIMTSFLAGFVLAFMALVRLYRAMPSGVRRVIEEPDMDEDQPATQPAATPLAAADITALDAKFGRPSDRSTPGA